MCTKWYSPGMRIEDTIEIAAPPDEVWRLTVDIEALPSMTPTMTRVERLEPGPMTVGSRARIKQPAQRSRVWTVTEFDEPRRFIWSTQAMGMTMTGIHQLKATERGTSNTLALELEGRLAPVLGPLVSRSIRRALAQENQGLRRAAEHRDRSAG
jgi:carbon monoxide dehydrogenase subunit G